MSRNRKKKPTPLPPAENWPQPTRPPDGLSLDAMKKIQYRLSNPPPPYQPLSGDVDAVFPTGAIQEKPGLTRRERNELTAVLAEISSRQKEALRLYRPWPIQEAFHASRAPTRLARGSNRAGKTLSTCVELARALTGQDPHGKYPAKGRCIVVGKDLIHCSKVIYRKLFKPGAFKIIRDFGTGEWRSYVPETDQEREDEAQDAPPLISPRYYSQKDMSWEDKREEILRSVRIKTGWEMTFFSGEGQPPQGWDVDLVCLSPWSELYDPVAGRHRRVDEIDGPFHVRSFNKKTGQVETRPASRPFIKGYGEIVRVSMSNGREIFTTRAHRVLSCSGDYLSVQEAHDRGIAIVALPHSDESLDDETPAGRSSRPCRKPSQSGWLRGSGTSPSGLRLAEPSAASRWNSPCCGSGRAPLARPTGDCPGSCSSDLDPCGERPRLRSVPCPCGWTSRGDAPSPNPSRRPSGVQGFGPGRIPISRSSVPRSLAYGLCLLSGRLLASLSRLSRGLARRSRSRIEAPSRSRQPSSASLRTSTSRSPDRASDVAGRPACGSECRPPSASEPRSSTRSDSGTRATRCCVVPQHRAVPTPPTPATRVPRTALSCALPPPGCEFESNHITSIEAVGQAEIWDIEVEVNHNYLYGSTVSHNCFDEEIPHPRWYPEMVPRLVDRGGRFIWSFTPQAGTVVAYELYERAMEEKGSPKPAIEDFLMTILDNPYISQAAKDRFYAELQFNEEELKVRFYGDFALKGMRVFPEFSKTGPHKIKPFDIPDDWTRQVAIDPGRRVAAALLKAIPPPGSPLLDRPVIYREVYCKQSTASRFAQELKMAIGPHHVRDWLIDHQHGRKRTEESGHTTEDIYAEELRKVGLEQQGFKGFIWAASDIAAGKTAAKGALQIVEGAPAWYFMIDQLPWFAWEIERYIDKRETKGGNIVDDISRSNLHNHLMDCFRYLAMHNSRYVKPPRPSSQVGWVNKLLDARRAKKRAGGGWGNSVRLS